MEDCTFVHGGARLACTFSGAGSVTGSGARSVLIFLHAGVADRRSWFPVMELLEREHPLIAYDRRGFGDTTWVAESFAHVADLAAIVDMVAGERVSVNVNVNVKMNMNVNVTLVGNSQGGRIAIDYALAHPGRVAALVLIAPAVSGEPDFESLDPDLQRMADALAAAEQRKDLAEVNRLEAHLWLDGPAAREGRVTGKVRELFLDMNGRALAAAPCGDERAPPSAVERLGDIRVPTLVLVGAQDLEPIQSRCKALAGRIPGARLAILPGLAHLPQLESPATVATLIGELLAADRR